MHRPRRHTRSPCSRVRRPLWLITRLQQLKHVCPARCPKSHLGIERSLCPLCLLSTEGHRGHKAPIREHPSENTHQRAPIRDSDVPARQTRRCTNAHNAAELLHQAAERLRTVCRWEAWASCTTTAQWTSKSRWPSPSRRTSLAASCSQSSWPRRPPSLNSSKPRCARPPCACCLLPELARLPAS